MQRNFRTFMNIWILTRKCIQVGLLGRKIKEKDNSSVGKALNTINHKPSNIFCCCNLLLVFICLLSRYSRSSKELIIDLIEKSHSLINFIQCKETPSLYDKILPWNLEMCAFSVATYGALRSSLLNLLRSSIAELISCMVMRPPHYMTR